VDPEKNIQTQIEVEPSAPSLELIEAPKSTAEVSI
jgi:hypothetical protein